MAKVTIIGATGNVGRFAAHTVSGIPHVTELLLIGRQGREDILEGLTRDFYDSFAAKGRNLDLSWTTDREDLRGSDIVIVSAGTPRQSGQSRNDLAYKNGHLVSEIARDIGTIAPDAILLMITNPVDVMTAVALRYSGLEARQVFGLGTHLDSMRLKALIASYFDVHVSEVHTRIIGEHGETMVPLWSATTIGGITVNNLPTFADLPAEEMVKNVRTAGENIIRKIGATIYGPGEAIGTLVRTILGNEKRILTVSSYVRTEVHDIGNVCIGVPARINQKGAFPVPIRIHEDEIAAFRHSVETIRAISDDVFARIERAE
ncbi:MAG: malate dehydrogenase [Methanomicrobiaceae archaeon]|nr:malate dehydrogenase [Methanomicrobiaceae archaeon]